MVDGQFHSISTQELITNVIKKKVRNGEDVAVEIIGEIDPSNPNKTFGFSTTYAGASNLIKFRTGGDASFLDCDAGSLSKGVYEITRNTGTFEMTSTIGAFIPNILTTTQRDALTPIEGMMIYNTTTNKLNFYNGSAWEVVTSI